MTDPTEAATSENEHVTVDVEAAQHLLGATAVYDALGGATTQPDLDILPAGGSEALDPEAATAVPTWIRRHQLARILGIPLLLTKTVTDSLRDERPDLFRVVETDARRVVECSTEILPLARERTPAPTDWTNDDNIAAETGADVRSIQRIKSRVREEYEGQFGRFKDPADMAPKEHYTQNVAERIRATIKARQAKRQQREKNERLKEGFQSFAEQMKAGETLEAQEFETLVKLFGAESAIDVLCQYRPEYKNKIVMPLVKSFLADYLGEFIVVKGELDFDHLDKTVTFLSNKNLKSALTEVIKRHCLHSYHQAIRKDPNQDDFDVIAVYLDEIRGRISDLESTDLADVIKEVEEYYLSLFEIVVPDNIVSGLVQGRPFPDLNQRINIKEIETKKRMLIADEPSMGKSASAILAKERIKAKCAVIITPSSVLDLNVWQNYLSDKVSTDGKQLGYFKPGKAPRVLIVTNITMLNDVIADDYDYILISEERINEEYTQALLAVGFDMLIVDEAHDFKNIREGVRSAHLIELAEGLSDPNQYLTLLTATPAPNKVGDIALMLKLLYPKKFTQFTNKEMVHQILQGDVLDIRGLLLPRMQIKRIADNSMEMPPLEEVTTMVELTDIEKEIYEILIDEWELEAREKMIFLRQVLLNPALLDATPDVPCAKVETVGADLRKAFETKDKVVMFVNGFVEGVIAGPSTIIPGLRLPPDVDVEVIYGKVTKPERRRIQDRFQNEAKKILLLVSGQAVRLGVDLSAAEELLHYNEPWTLPDKVQQIGRGWRIGRKGKLTARTYLSAGTIEEGIHKYIKVKYRAIEKLLFGIPLTDIEREMVEQGEATEDSSAAVNSDLAAYYFSSMDRMNKIFGKIKEIGEDGFVKFLERHGAEYAETYQDLTSRSYQANASRLSGTLISKFIKERGKGAGLVLDLGSGPEMLRRHITEEHADQIISLDINTDHFAENTGPAIGGSIAKLPVASGTADYINASLVMHYTAWQPSKERFERLTAFKEFNRVLKTGGRAVITMIYSLDLRNESAFAGVMEKLGFKVVDEYSGPVQSEDHFKGRVITLEKIDDCPDDFEELLEEVGPTAANGLRFVTAKNVTVRDTRKIATIYSIKDKGLVHTTFNSADQAVLEEEQQLLRGMTELRNKHLKIEDIPAQAVINAGYSRIKNGKGYVLFKRLKSGDGAVVLRNY